LTSYLLHKSKLLPRMQALKDCKDEYEAEVARKLAKYAKAGVYSGVGQRAAFTRQISAGDLPGIGEGLSIKSPIEIKIEAYTSHEHRRICFRSELEREFEARNTAFEFYKAKKQMDGSLDEARAAHILFGQQQRRRIVRDPSRDSVPRSPTSHHGRQSATGDHLENSTNRHTHNIQAEMQRRRRYKAGRFDAATCRSDASARDDHASVDRTSATAEAKDDKNLTANTWKTMVAFDGRLSQADVQLHLNKLPKGSGVGQRPSAEGQTAGAFRGRAQSLHHKARSVQPRTKGRPLMIASATDGFRRLREVMAGESSRLNRTSASFNRQSSARQQGRNMSFEIARPANQSALTLNASPVDVESTTPGHQNRVDTLSVGLPSKIRHLVVTRHPDLPTYGKNNFISKSLFQVCMEMEPAKRNKRLLSRILAKRSHLGLD
jgi:hypothetical protein